MPIVQPSTVNVALGDPVHAGESIVTGSKGRRDSDIEALEEKRGASRQRSLPNGT